MIAPYKTNDDPDRDASPADVAQEISQLERLRRSIVEAAGLLPITGPITSFAFLNTLSALEDMPFEAGMEHGAELYGCEPWLSEERYRAYMAERRIDANDLANVLYESLRESGEALVAPNCSRFDLRSAMLKFALPNGTLAELRWFMQENCSLSRFRADLPTEVKRQLLDDTRQWLMTDIVGATPTSNGTADPYEKLAPELAKQLNLKNIGYWTKSDVEIENICVQSLWRVCLAKVSEIELPVIAERQPRRLRDLLLKVTGDDCDLLVNEQLIRFCAAFTDQGMAGWSLPGRALGFYKSFCQLYQRPGGPPTHWTAGLAAEIERLTRCEIDPLESIRESLTMLGYEEHEWADAVRANLLALRGWAGLIWHMEVRPDRFAAPAPAGSLIDFVAVQWILERLAIEHLIEPTAHRVRHLNQLRDRLVQALDQRPPDVSGQRVFGVFQLAQIMGWSPARLARWSSADWTMLVSEIEAFGDLERRRLLHRAYERHFQCQALDAISTFARRATTRVDAPQFQAVFCIDAREESLRRHVEEVGPRVETFGVAGFFGVPMYYRGVADAHFTPLCPIVVQPKHWVTEEVVYTLAEANRRRSNARRVVATATHHVHMGSRGIAHGAVLTAGLGVLASIPLIARVFFPRLTGRFRNAAGRIARPPAMTRLCLHRVTATPGPDKGQVGFSTEEMADIAERTLRDIGLTYGFARLVAFVGHGSSSVNNPHKSVYDCGACTGNPGGPNARALAVMLNDSHVRVLLARRGVEIPRTTVFLGGLHNTCEDSITFYDLETLPVSHTDDFESMRQVLSEACERNAHERCRRFYSAPLKLSFAAAHRHVEERSMDLAQARPEFGNATNGLCVIGRRQRTRGLFLDRRSFLMSYDPAQDDAHGKVLERILSAVVPVCEGINMQYLLSHIDPSGWGCGTKLPHNITSLLGVMDGASSDLRAGLPWQGVEIHEPMRLLFVIESTPQTLRKIMHRNKDVGRILRNGWAQLATLSPTSNEVCVFRDGEFQAYEPTTNELPTSESSTNWYQGWRGPLEFASIDPAAAEAESRTLSESWARTTS